MCLLSPFSLHLHFLSNSTKTVLEKVLVFLWLSVHLHVIQMLCKYSNMLAAHSCWDAYTGKGEVFFVGGVKWELWVWISKPYLWDPLPVAIVFSLNVCKLDPLLYNYTITKRVSVSDADLTSPLFHMHLDIQTLSKCTCEQSWKVVRKRKKSSFNNLLFVLTVFDLLLRDLEKSGVLAQHM